MIYRIKLLLYRTLKLQTYLKLLHIGFFIFFKLRLLKSNYCYKYHYFIKYLINNDDVVIDIGANLGYYTRLFLNLVGSNGKVICFEPMPHYFQILNWAFNTKKNIKLYNYALGEDNKSTKIYMPINNDGFFSSGLSSLYKNNKKKNKEYEIKMVKGSSILSKMDKIDYIKIDIEGYEAIVIPEILEVIDKYKPIIQIETNNETVIQQLKKLSYNIFSVYKGKLIKNFDANIERGDYIFIHENKENEIINRLKIINRV